ncbi:MAG: hypothetical protein NWF06_03105 [Candidatus Bathyarchaeota archaeon]|nr:hypothetical protein [Candidatus Bathyarchaeum sp.]
MIEKPQNFVALKQVLTEILGELGNISDCQSVGIRLHNNGDYPYYVHKGLPDFFLRKESSLCTKDAEGNLVFDEKGNPLLDCMCGRVINGQVNPKLSYFTKKGSFWTNSTTQLLKSVPEKENLGRTRNMCHYSGYESVALIPMRSSNKTLGLIQMNDPRENMFTLKSIEKYEHLTDSVAAVVANALEIQTKISNIFELLNKVKSSEKR